MTEYLESGSKLDNTKEIIEGKLSILTDIAEGYQDRDDLLENMVQNISDITCSLTNLMESVKGEGLTAFESDKIDDITWGFTELALNSALLLASNPNFHNVSFIMKEQKIFKELKENKFIEEGKSFNWFLAKKALLVTKLGVTDLELYKVIFEPSQEQLEDIEAQISNLNLDAETKERLLKILDIELAKEIS